MTRYARCWLLSATLVVGLPPAGAVAQLPAIRLTSLQPAGGQRGGTLDVNIGGSDVDGVTRLLFSHPGITAKVKMRAPAETHPVLVAAGLPKKVAQPISGQFTVTIDKDVPPGVYQLRAVGRFGISNPRFFQVGQEKEVQEKEGNDSVAQAMEITLGTTINGRSDRATDEDHFKLELKKGERVLVDCYAWRIDSQLEPVLTIFDPRGIDVAGSHLVRRRDALLDFTTKEGGAYIVKLRDRTYRGGGDYFYRLDVHRRPHIDVVYPPVVHGGAATEVTLIGRNLPDSRPVEGFDVDGLQLESVRARIQAPATGRVAGALVESRDASAGLFTYRFVHAGVSSNPVLVAVGQNPVRSESEPNDDATKATRVEIPCEVGGRFWPRSDRDWIEFEAHKGEVLRMEVYSQRLGLTTDPVFAVYQVNVDKEGKESLKELVYQDDGTGNIAGSDFNTATDDPAWLFTAAADGLYRVQLRDLYGSSSADPRNVWRLSLRRVTPDFSLVATASYPAADQKKNPGGTYSPFLRRGGSDRVKVYALRVDGFKGAIEITCEGLPKGITQDPATIAAGANGTTITLRAAPDAPGWADAVRIVGKSKLGDTEVRRVAFCGARIWSANRSRVGGDVVLGVSSHEPAPLLASGVARIETAPGGKVELPVSLVRSSWATGKVAVEGSGVPKNVELKKFTINEKDSASKPTVNVKKGAPVGEHRFRLRADTEIQYRRDPRAAEAAKRRHDKLGEIVKSVEAAKGEADKRLAAATKAAGEAEGAAKKANETLTASDKALEAYGTQQEAAKKAADDAAVAVAAAGTATGPETEKLAQAKNKAQAALTDVQAKRQEAAAKHTRATQSASDAKTKSDAAIAARDAAAAAAKEAESGVKIAKDAQANAKKALDAANKANNPQKKKVRVESQPIVLRIAPSAVVFDGTVAPEKARLTQAGSVDVPVKIKRLYGFDGDVELKVTLPKDAKKLQAGGAKIAKGASEAKIKLEAAADASPREIEVKIEASGKLGGVDQKITAKFHVVIAARPVPPKTAAPKSPENKKE